MLAKIEEARNQYHIALVSEKIVELKKKDALTEYASIIGNVYFVAGQKSEPDMLTALCLAWHEEVKKYFPFLRMEEMRIAFNNGVRGEYKGEKDSDYIGINIATFNKWVKAFLSDQRRLDAKAAIKAASEKVYQPVMTKDEAEYEWKKTIKEQFAKFKETGHLTCEFPNYQFDEFEKRGLIKLSIEEKKKILEEAKQLIIKKKRLQRLNPKSKIELNELSEAIKRIESNQMRSTDQAEIKAQARKSAIKSYYESINSLNL